MTLLPRPARFWLFDVLSKKTMRYVQAIPFKESSGLTADVYRQIREDFFVNGSLSSRSKVPQIFAATWTAGRETILVDDQLDRMTKEAMVATLSSVNDCPYCGDMLVSLVHAADEHQAAASILAENESEVSDPILQERLMWVRAVATPGASYQANTPFSEEELPEALGAIMAMSDINRFSHVVMDGSPVNVPFGLTSIKALALRIFGNELIPTQKLEVTPGRSLSLLPSAALPSDMMWASSNPRIATALAQWTAAVEAEAAKSLSEEVMAHVQSTLTQWQGETMPMSRSWVETEVTGLASTDANFARLALILAKASYQLDDTLIREVLAACGDEESFIRVLSWCSFTAARFRSS